MVMIPITIVARGKGPTVLVLGGNHGDEYQGQIASMKLARELTPEKVTGRIILIPSLNLPAARAAAAAATTVFPQPTSPCISRTMGRLMDRSALTSRKARDCAFVSGKGSEPTNCGAKFSRSSRSRLLPGQQQIWISRSSSRLRNSAADTFSSNCGTSTS